MTPGPIDFLALEFPGNEIDGSITPADNSAAGLLLIENLWLIKTKQAMLDADARVVMFERIWHEVVEENLADMAAVGALRV
jgi:hypothetical protein